MLLIYGVTLPPVITVMWTSYGYDMHRLITGYSYISRSSCEENSIVIKKLHAQGQYESMSMSPFVSKYILCSKLQIYMYKQKYITGIIKCDVVTLVFRNNFLNIFIRCKLFHVTYIIPDFYCIIIECDHTIR